MIFSSTIFLLLFLPVTLVLYYIVPGKARNIILLLASLLFYWWGQPSYIWLLIISIVINWLGGLGIGKCRDNAARKILLIITVVSNVILLGIFKYSDFIHRYY